MTKFVGLHAHTGVGSIADGLGYPSEHFDYAQKNGMSAMAITDHGNCNAYGYMAEYAAKLKSKGNPFKVIYGIEAYLHPSLAEWKKTKEQKEAGDEEVLNFIENESESKGKHYDPIKRRHHLVLVATNQTGLRNIFKLVTRSYREGFYRMPRIDFSMLKEHNEGIIASSACLAGLGSWSVLKDLDLPDDKIVSNLENELTPLMEIFGKDRFFLEIQFNKLPEQLAVNKYMIELAKKTGFKNLATCDSHYCSPELWREREIYRILGRQKFGYTNLSMDEIPKSIDELKCELYPKNGDQLYDTFLEIYPEASEEYKKLAIEAIERSAEIADTIEYLGPDGEYKLPKYKGEKKNEFEELKTLCMEKLAEKELNKDPVYLKRLIRELTVIKNKNFSIYFTVLYEAIKELKKNMMVGPGRGSGAGSLVCYLLGITDLDPIRNELLFERFLSEAREEYPDIDNDVEDRDFAREILEKKFGKDNVVPVSNFNTLKLKSLIKDLGRLNDIPFEEVNAVTRVMEDEAKQSLLDEVGGDQKFYEFTLEGALKYSKTFQSFVEKYPQIKDGVGVLYKQFITLGRHAGGVVICEDASTSMPVIKAKGGVDQTPWSEGLTAKHLEQWGLVKYDFLGLGTLRIIKRAIELILKEKYGIKKPSHKDVYNFFIENLHPETVLDGDPQVFKNIYQEGKFPGVFQFAEQAVQNFCVKARPETVGDIATITSLWRPGPLKGKADKYYLSAKKGKEYIEFGHPVLEKVLGPTYGVLCIKHDQKVLMSDRSLMEISQTKVGDEVVTAEGSIAKISKVIPKGKKETFVFSFDDGSKLNCTQDHKIKTIEGYKEIGESNYGLIRRFERTNKEIKNVRNPYLLGLVVGDGCLNQSSPVICCESQEWATCVSNIISEMFDLQPTVYHHCRAWYAGGKRKDGEYKNSFNEWLKECEIWGKTKEDKIPEYLTSCSDDQICEFLAGYFDADGHSSVTATHFSSGYKKNLTIIGNLLDIIKISWYKPDTNHLHIRDLERFNDLIGPHLKNKKIIVKSSFVGKIKVSKNYIQNLVNKNKGNLSIKSYFKNLNLDSQIYWKDRKENRIESILKLMTEEQRDQFINDFLRGSLRISKIIDIENDGINEVYDLEIDHKDHSFIASGVCVHNCYQEQFMQLAHELAGYTLEEADKLRKLLVKPVTTMAEEMKKKREKEREIFISGCVERGLSEVRAERLWDEEILGFISYGFNKSHAIAYAYVSYQCAWLLHYYENQWLRAYLEVDSDRDKAVADVVGIGYKMGKPDILISSDSWKIEKGTVYPALSSIKGIGEAAVNELVEKRDSLKFDDFYDFMWSVEEKQFKNGKTKIKRNWRWSKFNKRAFDALIKVEGFGSFDIVGPGKLFNNYKEMYEFFIPNYDAIKRGKLELFDDINRIDDWEDEEKIDHQQEILGSYDKSLLFTQEVLDFFDEENILPLSDVGDTVNMHWFIVRNVKKATTKNGKDYVKLSISDVDDRIKSLNYFGYVPPEGLKRGSVYVSLLFVNDGWINVPYGQVLTKAS